MKKKIPGELCQSQSFKIALSAYFPFDVQPLKCPWINTLGGSTKLPSNRGCARVSNNH